MILHEYKKVVKRNIEAAKGQIRRTVLEELSRLYLDMAFEIRSDGGKEFDNKDGNDFFVKKSISWINVSKSWDNPFAVRGIRAIKHKYLEQVWIGNFTEFEKHLGKRKVGYFL